MTTNLLLIALFVFCMLMMFISHARKKKRVILFGDTVTGMDLLPGGYPSWLIDQMKEEGVEDEYEVLLSIQPNQNISSLYDRLHQQVLLKDANIVVIYAGVTDMLQSSHNNNETEIQVFTQGYASILDHILNRGCKVILCTPAPFLKEDIDADLQIQNERYLREVKDLSARYELPLLNIAAIYALGQSQPGGTEHINYNKLISSGLWQMIKEMK